MKREAGKRNLTRSSQLMATERQSVTSSVSNSPGDLLRTRAGSVYFARRSSPVVVHKQHPTAVSVPTPTVRLDPATERITRSNDSRKVKTRNTAYTGPGMRIKARTTSATPRPPQLLLDSPHPQFDHLVQPRAKTIRQISHEEDERLRLKQRETARQWKVKGQKTTRGTKEEIVRKPDMSPVQAEYIGQQQARIKSEEEQKGEGEWQVRGAPSVRQDKQFVDRKRGIGTVAAKRGPQFRRILSENVPDVPESRMVGSEAFDAAQLLARGDKAKKNWCV